MPCKFCKTKPVWKFTNKRQLCSGCFIRYFEKKVKSAIGKYNMPIHNIAGNLKANIINNIIKELPKRTGKISEESLDDISNKILYVMMYKNKDKLKNLFPKNQPLYFLSDKEITLYARIRGIKGKIKEGRGKLEEGRGKLEEGRGKLEEGKGKFEKSKLAEIDNFIKTIEQKNPDIRHNIVNALLT